MNSHLLGDWSPGRAAIDQPSKVTASHTSSARTLNRPATPLAVQTLCQLLSVYATPVPLCGCWSDLLLSHWSSIRSVPWTTRTQSQQLTTLVINKLFTPPVCQWHYYCPTTHTLSMALYSVADDVDSRIENFIFTARCYASAVLAMGLCLSQASVLLKRQNVGSHKQHHTIPQGV